VRAFCRHDWASIVGQSAIVTTEDPVMLTLAKMIATLASVAAAVCGLFAVSWVSLALLGF
jgi:hypothetical protein